MWQANDLSKALLLLKVKQSFKGDYLLKVWAKFLHIIQNYKCSCHLVNEYLFCPNFKNKLSFRCIIWLLEIRMWLISFFCHSLLNIKPLVCHTEIQCLYLVFLQRKTNYVSLHFFDSVSKVKVIKRFFCRVVKWWRTFIHYFNILMMLSRKKLLNAANNNVFF